MMLVIIYMKKSIFQRDGKRNFDNFALVLHDKCTRFQPIRARKFFVYILSMGNNMTERFVSMPSAKKQRKDSTTSRVSP